MITQEYKQGNNTIVIETAESIEDAKKNGFRDGEYSRYLLNNKEISYMDMIKSFVSEAKSQKKSPVPSGQDIMKLRQEMMDRQKEEIKKNLEKIKQAYGINHPHESLDIIDEMIQKLDPSGLRIRE